MPPEAKSVTDSGPNVGIGKIVLKPLEQSTAAGLREAIRLGVPPDQVINLCLNNLLSVVAMVDPAPVRLQTLREIQEAMPSLLAQHIDARLRTPGGVIIPEKSLG